MDKCILTQMYNHLENKIFERIRVMHTIIYTLQVTYIKEQTLGRSTYFINNMHQRCNLKYN